MKKANKLKKLSLLYNTINKKETEKKTIVKILNTVKLACFPFVLVLL
jgi:hypothetical protein